MTVSFSIAAFVAAVALAVTARFLRERSRAAELERRLDLLSRLSPVGVFHIDARGRCTHADDLSWRIAGLRVQRSAGDTWIDAVHPEDREQVVSEWAGAASAGVPYRGEYRALRPDGSTAWVLGEVRAQRRADGSERGFVGAVTDVSARKEAERALESLRADFDQRLSARTADLVETNRRLTREVHVRERVERALARIPSEVTEPKSTASRSRRVDQ